MTRRCSHIGANGQCRATPRTDNEFCYFHDVQVAEQRQAARIKGGRNSRKFVGIEGIVAAPTTLAEAKAIQGRVIAALGKGELDPRVAQAMTGAVNTFLAACKVSDLEERIKELERGKE